MKESKRLHKTVSDCEADITKAENDIKSNLKAQEDKKGEIEKQKKYIEEEVKSKYSKIK